MEHMLLYVHRTPATVTQRCSMRALLRSIVLALAVVVAAGANVRAQTGSITGTVRDEDGAVLPSVAVQVEGTRLGALTNAHGVFTIERVPVGVVWVTARLLSYEPARRQVTVRAGETATIAFDLEPTSIGIGGVEVRASKRQDQSDTRPSVTKIEPREAKYLPGAAEDVLRSLRSLPGVLAPNDFSAQLVVRGSGPDQNLIVLDDIEIFNPYRLYGLISMFNPETVSDITLLTAGFPANYGDRLSAVLDVTNREGERDEAVTGTLNASVTNANLVLEGALPAGMKGGWLLSTRRTYYDLIAGPILRSLNLLEGDVALPNFTDVQFKALMRPDPEHSIVVNALLNRDGTELHSAGNRERIDSISVVDQSYNWVAGASWRYSPNDDFLWKSVASWYQNTGETEFGGEGGSQLFYGDITRDSLIKLIRGLPPAFQDSLRARGIDPDDPPALGIDDGKAAFNFRKYTLASQMSLRLDDHLVEAGAGVDFIRTWFEFSSKPDSMLQALRDAGRRTGFPDSINTVVDFPRAHAFVQDRIAFDDELFVQLGARIDYYGMLDRIYLSPRASLSWAIDPITTLRAAWGLYYQSPGYEKLIDGQTFFDLTSPEIRTLRAERAMHYVLGADRMLDDEWQVKVEGYFKAFDDLIVQQRLAGTKYVSTQVEGGNRRYPSGWTRPVVVASDSVTTVPVNGATGEAYGVELLLQKIGAAADSKLNGWVSYALAWANRHRDGITYPFNFDQRHTVNVVLNYRANDWLELGASFRFGSGYPYTPATGYSPIVIVRSDSTGEKRPSVATNIFGEAIFRVDRGGLDNANSERLSAYHRLDLRATVYADWWDLDWSFYLDLVNAYNRANVLSRSYRVDRGTIDLTTREVYMLPILPTLGFSVRF
jgi:hypothetical protein